MLKRKDVTDSPSARARPSASGGEVACNTTGQATFVSLQEAIAHWESYEDKDGEGQHIDAECQVKKLQDVVPRRTKAQVKKPNVWSLTINNPTREDWECFQTALDRSKYFSCKGQLEKESTLHIQAVVRWDQKGRTFEQVKSMFPRAHIEPGRHCKALSNYVMKEDTKVGPTFAERWEDSEQGKRSDIHDVVALLMEGTSIADLAEQCPIEFVKYHRGLQELSRAVKKQRLEKPSATWHISSDPNGLTRSMLDESPNAIYVANDSKWWEGYENQDIIIFNDWVGMPTVRDLQRLLSGVPLRGEMKGSHVLVTPKDIVVTAEEPPPEKLQKYFEVIRPPRYGHV